MLLGLDVSIWRALLVVLVCPVLVVAALNVVFRKRGGIGPGWGGALAVMLAGVMALLVIFDKVRL